APVAPPAPAPAPHPVARPRAPPRARRANRVLAASAAWPAASTEEPRVLWAPPGWLRSLTGDPRWAEATQAREPLAAGNGIRGRARWRSGLPGTPASQD